MPISAVSARYANALADVVTGPASTLKPQDASRELRSFVSLLQGSAELHNALVTPAVPNARKRAVIARLADALGISKVSRNFLYVLIDHRRIASVADIADSLDRELDRRLGIEQAEVISPNELNEQQRTALQAQLARLTGKQIRMRFATDGTLIGGVMARIGSTVYDGSVRGQLEALGRRLGNES